MGAQSWNSSRRVITRLIFSLFKTNLKLKIAATACTYLRGEAGWHEAGMILLENVHKKFSNVLAVNMLPGDYEVVFLSHVQCILFYQQNVCLIYFFLEHKKK